MIKDELLKLQLEHAEEEFEAGGKEDSAWLAKMMLTLLSSGISSGELKQGESAPPEFDKVFKKLDETYGEVKMKEVLEAKACREE